MKYVTRIVFLSSLLCTAGCAFGTRHAEMGYPPVSENGGMIPAAHAASMPVGRSRDVILAVSDGRTETHRIGNVRNGFGMDTANVVTEDDLESWVEGAFTHELTNAGCKFSHFDSLAASCLNRLDSACSEVHRGALPPPGIPAVASLITL
jgi:hypothetical protein